MRHGYTTIFVYRLVQPLQPEQVDELKKSLGEPCNSNSLIPNTSMCLLATYALQRCTWSAALHLGLHFYTTLECSWPHV